MSFEALLDDLKELQDFHKSMATNAETDEAEEEEEEEEEGEGEGNKKPVTETAADLDADDDELLNKSFTAVIGDTEVEAIDGTQLVKSLISRISGIESNTTVALETMVDLVKSQGDLIKSLQDKITALGRQGRGRQSLVSVAERPAVGDLQKSEPPGMPVEDFMAKALTAQACGKITGLDVTKAETSLAKGLPVPDDIVRRVLN